MAGRGNFFFFFFFTHFFPAARPKPRSLHRPCWPHAFAHAARAASRLVAGPAVQRESARTSCSSGSGLPPWHSPCSGSSSNDVAKARCAATERMPLQRCTQAPRAVTRRAAGAAAARARASKRTNCAASRDQRPPTSTPKTTRRHRRALSSSG